MREVAAYWAERYDRRATEARLNAIPQFTTAIDGLDVHFLHARSPHAQALPLVMTHGWPGSVVEFLQVIGPLSDPTGMARRRTPSTWSARRCPAMASRASRPAPAGAWRRSARRGTR
ncbi:MAG: epoxide hydrolase N-terminal domain-containing protein [Dehalococcoidia bacterium]